MSKNSVKRVIFWLSLLLFIVALFLGVQLPMLFLGLLWILAGNFAWLVYPFYLFSLISLRKDKQIATIIFSLIALFFAIVMSVSQVYANRYWLLWGVYVLPTSILIVLIYAYIIYWQAALSKQRIKLYIGTAIVILIAIGLYQHFIGRYQPKLNPHPKYFMTVKGYVDPAIANDVKLTWSYSFYSTNDQCDVMGFAVMAGGHSRSKDITVPLDVDEKGFYRFKIPLDKYLPGFCQWQILGFGYKIKPIDGKIIDDADTTFSFNATKNRWGNTIKQHWICDKKDCQLQGNNSLANAALYPFLNYYYELSLMGRKNQ